MAMAVLRVLSANAAPMPKHAAPACTAQSVKFPTWTCKAGTQLCCKPACVRLGQQPTQSNDEAAARQQRGSSRRVCSVTAKDELLQRSVGSPGAAP